MPVYALVPKPPLSALTLRLIPSHAPFQLTGIIGPDLYARTLQTGESYSYYISLFPNGGRNRSVAVTRGVKVRGSNGFLFLYTSGAVMTARAEMPMAQLPRHVHGVGHFHQFVYLAS